MTVEEATVVAAAEEAIVAAEKAIEDKDKSSHWLIGGSNKDEGSDSDFGSVSGRGSDEISVTTSARIWRLLRRDNGGSSEAVRRWLENSIE